MGDVVAQDPLREPAQRGAHRRHLRHDVDAVAVVLDHARQAAHLALDPAETLEAGGLGFGLHGCYIPIRGIGVKARTMSMDSHSSDSHSSPHAAHGASCPHDGASAHLAKDPVCGMTVDPHTAGLRAEHAGRTYYFCSAGCRPTFPAHPPNYLLPPPPPPPLAPP